MDVLTMKFKSPSGKVFELREQNGADDELLSRISTTPGKELEIMNQFLASIIVSIDGEEPITVESLKSVLLRDKYAMLIRARVFSLGEELKFEYQWDKDKPPTEYSEDLMNFIWDYEKPFPGETSGEYFHQRIKPYPESSKEGFFEVRAGKRNYRLDYLTGAGEEMLFAEKTTNVNSHLVARNLTIETDQGQEIVKSFKEISSRDLAIIRSEVAKQDPIPEAEVSVENPYTGSVEVIPLLAIRDFFFPTLL